MADTADPPAPAAGAAQHAQAERPPPKRQKQPQKPAAADAEQPSWLRINADGTKSVLEGSAEIVFAEEVFYNPVQQFNRDMSVAAISVWRDMFFLERAAKARRKAARAAGAAADAGASADAAGAAGASGDGSDGDKDADMDAAGGDGAAAMDAAEAAGSDADAAAAAGASPGSAGRSADKKQERSVRQAKALAKAAGAVAFERVDLSHADFVDQRFSVLEALSATGLRAVRYAKEIGNIGHVVANDLLDAAVQSIQRSAAHNGVDGIVRPNKGDACQVMYRAIGDGQTFDVVDLDPYGSAAPFLDGAVQAVTDGGSQPESCWAKYGGINIPGAQYTHELALRILLHAIQAAAARHRRTIEPLLSCSIDFYVRVFVRVRESAALVKQAASTTSLVFHCTGCRSFVLQPLGKLHRKSGGGDGGVRYGPSIGPAMDRNCVHCGGQSHVGGPFFSDPIHSSEFVARMLDLVAAAGPAKFGTHTRMAGMLAVQSEELPIPLYFTLPTLGAALHCQNPSMVKLTSAILHAGHKVSQSHAAQGSIKTDAPADVIWDILRCWCKQHPPSDKNMSPNSPARRLLAVEPRITANFEKHPKATPDSRKYQLVRYQENPTANWGPKARPKKHKRDEGDHGNDAGGAPESGKRSRSEGGTDADDAE
ncbi:RNA methyltransferase tRNA(m5U54)methyltransferase [Polyrhizophydium stewartii]|uniref:tRNA (guanine(26)-N(2))-dimethyltransferase n=1 Tax=Polyrhizophydium stewartii TaxID=2732419 RepID=A0ABR4MYW2_9FUNG